MVHQTVVSFQRVGTRMSFAEVFLRLGCALVAWLVSYAHCVWLAVLPMVDCTQVGIEPWRATLFAAVPSAIFAALLPIGRTVPGVASTLRWFALPLVVLWPLAVRGVLPVLADATWNGLHWCGEARGELAPVWLRVWAPLQLGVLCGIAAGAVVAWRPRV